MAVTRDQIDAICATFPGATPAHPPELVSWKVGGKMYACFGGDGDMDGVSVKTESADMAAMLIDTTSAVKAPYFHASWVRLRFDDADLDEVTHRLGASYDLIRKSLKKAERDALPAREVR
ncbi:MmcQ/YjbR family DNA-binding protein [Marivita hallyeonensis]|uniref:Predicted DNA-binding protein, MmcQ/YjbR family n=1 Tax=Marivita hallyeonensis TaxID=996342 RepID=A0A1M5QGF3_9RHOB|nr:MmcQ/YjbR family DNA-binding protein [Marivita hallyeonensis]SHH13294.1 Predicted DNA-binding protein, MmcQ/YjbR family [Marivita hallyeonensis]